nr:nucleoside-diphosphate sugar epimerase/dehydratase [Mariniplasma anaerobium]
MMMFKLDYFQYNLYAIAFFTVSTLTLGTRLSYRTYKYYLSHWKTSSSLDRTLIIGAGNAGILLFDEISKNPKFNMRVIGFIDDNDKLAGKTIRGIPVLGTTDDLSEVVFKYKAVVTVIAIPSLGIKDTTELINKVELTGSKIKLMPPFYEMVGSKESLVKLRDVDIVDLLGRKPIYLDEVGIKEYIDSKTIVVTGGGGSIGSELCRQLIRFNPKKIIIIDIYENGVYDLQMEFERMYRLDSCSFKPEIIVLIASVRDELRIDEIFKEYKPDVVFHAAAHKHVPLMEVSPKEAIKNNILGTYNVSNMADKHKVKKFVFISTDKAVNPTNVMGAKKRFAERIVMALNEESYTDFAAVRFGNVLGSNGSVIPLFQKQIAEGGPVTVTHPEIIRYFMTISEACQLVIQAGAYAKGGELFVLDMGEPVKILDLAEKLIRLSGLEPYRDIEIEFTGLRPGEKMFEELLVDYSKAHKTENEKIFVEPVLAEKKYNVLEEMANIDSALCKSSNGTAVKLLKQYVTTYKNGD